MKEGEIVLREYLYSLRFYLLFVIILFIGAIAVGYMGFMSETFNESLAWLQQLSEGIEDFTELYPSWLIFLMFFIVIFLNNAFTCFLNILTGPLIGIFPLFSAVLNGGLIGWLAKEEGLIVFLRIVPHGMFELPAYFLSVAIGLRLAREVFKRKEERQLKMKLGEGLRVYLILIVPLLLVAAFIESGLIVLYILATP
ncbi:MAG TPA: stage II sporulation protein M [Candidatus Bathyarchaeia archaeon]|nr:stage II sporulation protein M [Candidatus Bathyarchaeia archaeon]